MKLQTHLILFFGCTILLACKSKTVLTPVAEYHPPVVVTPDTISVEEERPVNNFSYVTMGSVLEEFEINAETIEMQGSVSLVNSSDKYNFNVTIRMMRDSAIWVQLKKLGLEGARMLATRDSVFMIDRLHRTYFKKSWAQIQSENKIPIDFHAMYRLLLGVPPYNPMDSARITHEENAAKVVYEGAESITEISFANPLKRITEFIIIEPKAQNKLDVKLHEYKLLYDNKKFSYLRDIEIHSNNVKQLYVNLSIVQVSRDKSFRIPFDILPGYQQMD